MTGAARVLHRRACEAAVAELMQQHTRAEWMERLEACGIPCSPVHNLGGLSNTRTRWLPGRLAGSAS